MVILVFFWKGQAYTIKVDEHVREEDFLRDEANATKNSFRIRRIISLTYLPSLPFDVKGYTFPPDISAADETEFFKDLEEALRVDYGGYKSLLHPENEYAIIFSVEYRDLVKI